MTIQQRIQRDVLAILKEQYQENMEYEEICYIVLNCLLNEWGYRSDLILERGETIKREIDIWIK